MFKRKKKEKQIKVPFWLDFQPCRTRYIEAVKAYEKFCGRSQKDR